VSGTNIRQHETGAAMKVMVLGIRGVPNVQGGVETHSEQLYPRLVARGCEVEIIVRSPFVPAEATEYQGARLTRLWSPRRAGLETMVHSWLGVFYAALKRPDVLHVHAIGPALITPVARLLGLRVVVTHHGPDYNRDKWGPLARRVLRTGERLGMTWANQRIAVSRVITELVSRTYGRDAVFIPNGVNRATHATQTDHLQRHGLVPGRYILQVSRIVPEKRQLDLIEAYARLKPTDWKLVLVGALPEDAYSLRVIDAAAEHGVILTGYRNGEALRQYYSHAGCFVLPSSHEGLPIAMLEALSHGLPVIASDISANLEVALPQDRYFPLGDIDALAERLRTLMTNPCSVELRLPLQQRLLERYDWESIADATLEVYQECRGADLPAKAGLTRER
jgi:glycosyltransferase involved in cell wall biosynthesis